VIRRSRTVPIVAIPDAQALILLLCVALAVTAALLYFRRPARSPLSIVLAVVAVAMTLAAVGLAAVLLPRLL
jgi:hypothetical protein